MENIAIRKKVNQLAKRFVREKGTAHSYRIWKFIGKSITGILYRKLKSYIRALDFEYDEILSLVYIWIIESLEKYESENNIDFVSHCYAYCYWRCSDYFRSFITNSNKTLNKNNIVMNNNFVSSSLWSNFASYKILEESCTTNDLEAEYSDYAMKETKLNILISIISKNKDIFTDLEHRIISLKLLGEAEKAISKKIGIGYDDIRKKLTIIKRKIKRIIEQEKPLFLYKLSK